MRGPRSSVRAIAIAAFGTLFVLGFAIGPPAAAKVGPGGATFSWVTPVFGMETAPDGSLLVADYGQGIVQLKKGTGKLVASLPMVTDIAPIGGGTMFAITGGGGAEMGYSLYRVSRGGIQQIADLSAFETAMNPDGMEDDSNPFEVVALSGGTALVADAGGNDLLIIAEKGNVDWIAVLPLEMVSTQNAKDLIECPDPPEDLPDFIKEICDLPDKIPAQPVATSVAIGSDGAYYVSELKGFPAPLGESRIWRIEAGTLHAQCGESPACSVVADGFTSIVDLSFGPDGTLYVTEIDEASWLAVELVPFFGPGILQGGTVNACDVSDWTCTEVAMGLPIAIATSVAGDGVLYAAILALVPPPDGFAVVPLS
ncbi:MAG: ScyD/ScyE family protein [Thermoplasmata archaeon]